ncbi:hypothetical protein BV25DRAFT_1374869 [Artomyces pyxidatus]|uniref:Uncharacterized protein n=1 Tax=Artomyces pyxidatus TaxID=48021 RepID=A0ACB8TD24_9AGAM|nr:hypothetical protein BV25DRAFT_1374869 [Artomyces pyxidatus]
MSQSISHSQERPLLSCSPLNHHSALTAQPVMDEELSAMHLAMCSVRGRRNTISPIHRLPIEVLSRFFSPSTKNLKIRTESQAELFLGYISNSRMAPFLSGLKAEMRTDQQFTPLSSRAVRSHRSQFDEFDGDAMNSPSVPTSHTWVLSYWSRRACCH